MKGHIFNLLVHVRYLYLNSSLLSLLTEEVSKIFKDFTRYQP